MRFMAYDINKSTFHHIMYQFIDYNATITQNSQF